jgi:hypothetical protein
MFAAQGLRLLENGQLVSVLGYDLNYSPRSDEAAPDLWFADVPFNYSSTYMPFLRLALTRLQSVSLRGCMISKIAFAPDVPSTTCCVVVAGNPVPGTANPPTDIRASSRVSGRCLLRQRRRTGMATAWLGEELSPQKDGSVVAELDVD